MYERFIPFGGGFAEVINYVGITCDTFLPSPKCPKCGEHMKLSPVGGMKESSEFYNDFVSGYLPTFVCMGMVQNPDYGKNKLKPGRRMIPCERHYKLAFNKQLGISTPKQPDKRKMYYRNWVPIFSSVREVIKLG